MDDALHATLVGWGNFYVVTGAAAATLMGLQFVVQTLLASNLERLQGRRNPEEGIHAFATPTVVHFSLAMLVSALLCAPWPGAHSLRLGLGLFALGALTYAAIVLRRMRRQTIYRMSTYDWVWHGVLPTAAYATMVVAHPFIAPGAVAPFFAVGAATLLLLAVGVHNSWDTVTYFMITRLEPAGPRDDDAPPPSAI